MTALFVRKPTVIPATRKKTAATPQCSGTHSSCVKLHPYPISDNAAPIDEVVTVKKPSPYNATPYSVLGLLLSPHVAEGLLNVKKSKQ